MCRDRPTPKFARVREIACRQSSTMSGRPRTDPPAAVNNIVPVRRLFPSLLTLGARSHVLLDELRLVVAHPLAERRHAGAGNAVLDDQRHVLLHVVARLAKVWEHPSRHAAGPVPDRAIAVAEL